METLCEKLAKQEINFNDLPPAVVHEGKRLIMDSIGCALAGISSDKGKVAIMLAKRLGGPPESSIIGLGDKVSCSNAAFANGELINALDYDAILHPPGHPTPFILPGLLAIAESVAASGQDLILATIWAHEISMRISKALQPPIFEFVNGEGRESPVSGFSQCIFGGVFGIGKILRFDHGKMANALGLAGYLCPVPTVKKCGETIPVAMTKYGPAGWTATAAVHAAVAAQMGYNSDISVFEGEYGFWRFFGHTGWKPEVVMERLGEVWGILETKYKAYPCCLFLHAPLDCFTSIIEANNIMPEEIETVKVLGSPLLTRELHLTTDLQTPLDSQFSTAYAFAAAAHRVEVGAAWQDWDVIRNPKMLEFMKKVNSQVHPDFVETVLRDHRSSMARVEVVARGKTFSEERMYAPGTPFTDANLSDEALVQKFRHNAAGSLTQEKINEAVKVLLELEKVEDVRELMKQLTL